VRPKHDEPKHEPDPKHDTARPRVATVDTSDVRAKADAAYQAKRFSDAANLVSYSVATAPATRPVDAYDKLQEAIGYDHALSGAFEAELTTKLAQVAPKAAVQFLALKDFKKAHLAVIKAEASGGTNDSTKVVRQYLEKSAGDLYNQASGEADSDADGAKDKCRKVLEMVDATSPWAAKAKKLLAQLAK
jgi:hypothetical protein